MGTPLHDFPLSHHDYLVRRADGAQMVRHHKHCSVLRKRRNGSLHEHLVNWIHTTRHLVEYEDRSVF